MKKTGIFISLAGVMGLCLIWAGGGLSSQTETPLQENKEDRGPQGDSSGKISRPQNPGTLPPPRDPSENDPALQRKAFEIARSFGPLEGGSLYEAGKKMKDLMGSNIEGSEKVVLSVKSHLKGLDIMSIFFLLASFIEVHPSPVPTIVDFISQKAPPTALNEEEIHHGVGSLQKANIASVYALDEIEERIKDSPPDKAVMQKLERVLGENLKTAKDLMVLRHSISKLKDLFGYSSQRIKKMISHRDPNESFAFSDLLED